MAITKTWKPRLFVPDAKGIVPEGMAFDQSVRWMGWMSKNEWEYEPFYKTDPAWLDEPIMRRLSQQFEPPEFVGSADENPTEREQNENRIADHCARTRFAVTIFEEILQHNSSGDWWWSGETKKRRVPKTGNVERSFKIDSFDGDYILDFLKCPSAIQYTITVPGVRRDAIISEAFELPVDIRPSTLVKILDQAGFRMMTLVSDTARALCLLDNGVPVVPINGKSADQS